MPEAMMAVDRLNRDNDIIISHAFFSTPVSRDM